MSKKKIIWLVILVLVLGFLAGAAFCCIRHPELVQKAFEVLFKNELKDAF